MRRVLAGCLAAALALSCREGLGGRCETDASCGSGLVCERALCTLPDVRRARLEGAADRSGAQGASGVVARQLHLDAAAAARLASRALGDWALVRTPGHDCFWLHRDPDGWLVLGTGPRPPDGQAPFGLAPAEGACRP